MGVQIPCGIHSEMPAKGVVGAVARTLGRSIPTIGSAEGEPGGRRSSDAGSCAYAAVDTAEVCGVASGGLHQG